VTLTNGIDHDASSVIDRFAIAYAAKDQAALDRITAEAKASAGRGAAGPLLIPVRAGNEFSYPPPSRRWVSPYFAIAQGRPTMFCAPPGLGKGWLAQGLQWSLVGRRRLGQLDVVNGTGPTLWLDYEEGEDELWRRHARMRIGFQPDDIDDSLIRYVDCTLEPGRTFNDPRFVDWLGNELKGYTLCIIDNLTECYALDDRNSADARTPIKLMNELSLRTGCAFAVIYHPRKGRQDERDLGQDAVRGSSAIVGSCGSVWIGRKTREQNATRWIHEKCNGRPKSDPFDLVWRDTEEGGIVVEARAAEVETEHAIFATKVQEIQGAIRQALAARPLGANQLEQACREAGLSFKAVAFRGVRDSMVESAELEIAGGARGLKTYALTRRR
jgi:hypothetical protein